MGEFPPSKKGMEKFNKGEIDADNSCQIEKQILTDEIQAPEFLEFAVENISELFGYIASGRVNIRICRDITGLPDGLFGGPARPARLPVRTAWPGGRHSGGRAFWRVRCGLGCT